VGADSGDGGGQDTGGGGESSKYYPQIDVNDPGRKFTYDNKYYGEEEDRLIECDFVEILDNTGSNFDSAHAQGQIPWGIYTNNEEASQGYGGDAAWRECPLKIRTWGPEQASWTRSGLDAGMYKVWMTWPIHHKEWRRISGIPYSITAGDESTGGTIDQTALPSGEEYDGKNWQELAEIQLTAGEDLVIKLGAIDAQFGSSGGPLVLADAIRIECLELD